jgi:hypothetical protein
MINPAINRTMVFKILALLDRCMILRFAWSRKLTKKLIASSYEQITLGFHVVPLWCTSNQQCQNFIHR